MASMFDPYEADRERIARRRKLAEALMTSGLTPLGGTEYAGGIAVRRSPLEGVAKIAQAYAGQMQADRADEDLRKLGEERRGDIAAAIEAYTKATTARPAEPEIPMAADEVGGGPGRPAVPAYAPDTTAKRTAAMNLMGRIGDPRDAAKLMVAEALKAPANPFGKVDMKDYTPESVRAFMASGGTDYSVLKPVRKVEFVAGQAVDPYATAPGTKISDPNQLMNFGPDGQPAVNQALVGAKKDIARAGASNTSVSVSTEKKYGEQFGGLIAKADVDMCDAAIKAPALAERANRVKEVLASGKVITGAGADIRLGIGKALGLAGASDQETLVNTETLMTSLAQNTLDAIKASGLGSGTGFSNADRDFLEKAVGGKITLESGTINRLADLAHRAAEKSAENWSTRVKAIPESALQGTGITRDAVAVPKLFQPKPAGKKEAAPAANPDLERALQKYLRPNG